jgi:hypothetical protein
VIVYSFLSWNDSVQVFYCLFITVLSLAIQLSRGGGGLGFFLLVWPCHMLVTVQSQEDLYFHRHMSWYFCAKWLEVKGERWSLILLVIGGIDDHHCLNFLFRIKQKYYILKRISIIYWNLLLFPKIVIGKIQALKYWKLLWEFTPFAHKRWLFKTGDP